MVADHETGNSETLFFNGQRQAQYNSIIADHELAGTTITTMEQRKIGRQIRQAQLRTLHEDHMSKHQYSIYYKSL